ncbi:MAG: MarR family winged helix-turn-helix transcriptional regulator [Hyphomicrobiaceae bacterium]
MPQPNELRAVLKAIRRIARAVDLHSRRIDRDIGLTLPQLVVLTCVRDLGEVTSRAISAEADLSPATVVGILDKLEAKGLIQRYRSQVDRRIVHTRLTASGQAMLAAAPPPLGAAFERAFNRRPAAERTATVDALSRLAKLAEADLDEHISELAVDDGIKP